MRATSALSQTARKRTPVPEVVTAPFPVFQLRLTVCPVVYCAGNPTRAIQHNQMPVAMAQSDRNTSMTRFLSSLNDSLLKIIEPKTNAAPTINVNILSKNMIVTS